MAKTNKKSAKETSELFHNRIKASVANNPKPTSKAEKDLKKREDIKRFAEIAIDLYLNNPERWK